MIAPGKISLIHNWQDEDEFMRYHNNKQFKKDIHGSDKPFTFMYLGNIGPLSGIEYVIQGFHLASIPNARLVIAGSGSMKNACMGMARKLNNQAIQFMDVPHGKVPEIQDEADVMILHVRKGGAFSSVPSKLPAYMFSKKPVIACVDNGSDTANAVMAAKCGWVVPPEDIGQLALSLHEAANTPCNELLDMGIHGFDYAMERFSKRNNLDKMVQLISETLRA
jgi:glycosyltransferase involved in cell wall biosynthesis